MTKHLFPIRGLLGLAAVAVALMSCSTNERGVATPETAQVAPPTNYEFVDVFRYPPKRPYQVIGTVKVLGTADATVDSIIKILRQKAAGMGAQAIILIRPNDPIFPGRATQAQAIRWTGPKP